MRGRDPRGRDPREDDLVDARRRDVDAYFVAEPALRTGGVFALTHALLQLGGMLAAQALAHGVASRSPLRVFVSIGVDVVVAGLLLYRIEAVRIWAFLRGVAGVALTVVVLLDAKTPLALPGAVEIGAECAFAASLGLVLFGSPGTWRLAMGWVLFAAYAVPSGVFVAEMLMAAR